MKRLHGKVALVTGAAGNIGTAIVKLFEDEGATVLGVDIARKGDEHCDVNDAASAAAAVQAAERRYGVLHILVNNAAAVTPYVPLHEVDEKDWRRGLDVNLTGAFLMSKYAVPAMLRAGSGVILHMASQWGSVGAKGRGVYGASKAGLITLAKIMALDYAANGIRVNSISPGAVMTTRVLDRYGSEEAVNKNLGPGYPIGRIGRADDVAQAALYLASDAASFVTGTDLQIDGGYTAQ